MPICPGGKNIRLVIVISNLLERFSHNKSDFGAKKTRTNKTKNRLRQEAGFKKRCMETKKLILATKKIPKKKYACGSRRL